MKDYRAEPSIGARISSARRQRGYRTARELAGAIPGGKVTAAVLENIESGRRTDIRVSQLLNIARALGVPPTMLLASIGNPNSELDLPNLSDDFKGMTAAEFDCWLSAAPASSYRPQLAAERADIDTLNSLRELGTLQRELERLQVILDVHQASEDPDLISSSAEVQERIDRIRNEAARVGALLESAGLTVNGEEAGRYA